MSRVIVPEPVKECPQNKDKPICCEVWRYSDIERCTELTDTGELCARHATERLRVQVTTSQIPNAGLGLFTLCPRTKWEFICLYLGEKISVSQYSGRQDQRYGMEFGKYVLDASSTTDGFGRYLNHSKDSYNCVAMTDADYWAMIKGRPTPHNCPCDKMFIVAARDIDMGAELLLNYGCGYQL